jgi:glutamate N-acetyltransferase/amino-acid N-acetyltransferase
VCKGLADDVVRNGEGTNHVIEVKVIGSPSNASALGLGRAVVNSPLLKCAVAGNDPNVGRLVAAVGKYVGDHLQDHISTHPNTDTSGGPQSEASSESTFHPIDAMARCRMKMGGRTIFDQGQFR